MLNRSSSNGRATEKQTKQTTSAFLHASKPRPLRSKPIPADYRVFTEFFFVTELWGASFRIRFEFSPTAIDATLPWWWRWGPIGHSLDLRPTNYGPTKDFNDCSIFHHVRLACRTRPSRAVPLTTSMMSSSSSSSSSTTATKKKGGGKETNNGIRRHWPPKKRKATNRVPSSKEPDCWNRFVLFCCPPLTSSSWSRVDEKSTNRSGRLDATNQVRGAASLSEDAASSKAANQVRGGAS